MLNRVKTLKGYKLEPRRAGNSRSSKNVQGKIQLSGFVRSGDQKSAAETIAKGIPGVLEVENRISLKQ